MNFFWSNNAYYWKWVTSRIKIYTYIHNIVRLQRVTTYWKLQLININGKVTMVAIGLHCHKGKRGHLSETLCTWDDLKQLYINCHGFKWKLLLRWWKQLGLSHTSCHITTHDKLFCSYIYHEKIANVYNFISVPRLKVSKKTMIDSWAMTFIRNIVDKLYV